MIDASDQSQSFNVSANITKPMTLNMPSDLNCCIEKALSEVNVLESLNNLETLLKPCKRYQKNKINIVQQAIFFFLHINNSNHNKLICRKFYCNKPTSDWMIVYITVLTLTLLIAIFGNAFACYVILRVRSLRRLVTYQLLMSLAVSDFLVSFFVIPVKISTATTNMAFCNSLDICRLFNTTDTVFFTASVTHLLVITIDRYLSISKPYFYKCQRVRRFYKAIIITVWLYSVLWGIISNINLTTAEFVDAFSVDGFHCRRRDFLLPRLLYIIVFLLPFFAMSYMNKRIWSIAVKQGHEIEKQKEKFRITSLSSASTDSPMIIAKQSPSRRHGIKNKIIGKISNSNNEQFNFIKHFKSELKATKVMLSVFGIFTICWAPVILITFIHTYKPLKINKTVLLIFCEFLPNFHSCLNPFIYCFFHKEFINGLRRIWFRMSFVAKHEMSLKRRNDDRMILKKRHEKLEERDAMESI